MNKIFFHLLGLIFLVFLLNSKLSCNSFTGISPTSDSLEILVVYEQDAQGSKLELFKKYFFLPQKTITETELTGDFYNIFEIIYINNSDFSEYFKGYRNIVFLSLHDAFSAQTEQDKWVPNQTVLYYTIDSLAKEKVLEAETKKIIQNIKDIEIQRRIEDYQRFTKKEIKDFIYNEFDLSVSLPGGFSIVESMDRFIDVRRDFSTGTHRIIIQEIPNQDYQSQQLTINTINQIFEKNIHGEANGSFAIIEDVWSNVYMEKMNINNYTPIEIRGLWKIKNDPAPMGGPFLGYILQDFKHEKSLFIGVCIFAPGEEKASHLMDAEAIGKSLFY